MGSLEKRGHWRKTWKERYFTLIAETKQLKYFSNSGQTNIKGEIYLDHGSTVNVYEKEEMENHCHVFVLKARQHSEYVVHYLSARSEKNMRQWIQAIEETIHDGFPLINLPEIWPHSFYSTSHVLCTFDHLDGNLERKPADHHVTLGELKRPPLVSFSKSARRMDPSHEYFTIVMYDLNLPPSGYLCWLIMNVIDQDMYTGNGTFISLMCMSITFISKRVQCRE